MVPPKQTPNHHCAPFAQRPRLAHDLRRILCPTHPGHLEHYSERVERTTSAQIHLGRNKLFVHVVVSGHARHASQNETTHCRHQTIGNCHRRMGHDRRGQLKLLFDHRANGARSRVAQDPHRPVRAAQTRLVHRSLWLHAHHGLHVETNGLRCHAHTEGALSFEKAHGSTFTTRIQVASTLDDRAVQTNGHVLPCDALL
jgi:hypothetical protein